ncbi:hypothetical protein KC360_g5326 [Hortaea werneckii]|nr:hypothetical protein KC325_g3178 [Hortaea werneckii]KAI6995569.1 hypothetical protein KC359_g3995 [Hortaea werneckii]KAI7147327.1 hypothetical protein KC344_g2895 [Hortaea werneckii]KAI7172750.1 hypothetical protein KC360_g5326 [Hortaea werneckii]
MGKKGKPQGKKPKGRAAARGKAQKNSPRGGPGGGWANNFVRQSDGLFADSDEEPMRGFKGFAQSAPRGSVQQRATNVKLRHQTIAFVSAGTNTPAEPEVEEEDEVTIAVQDGEGDDEDGGDDDDDEDDDEEEEIDDSVLQTNITMDTETEGAMASMNLQGSGENSGWDTDGMQEASAIVDTPSKAPAPAAAAAEPLFVVDVAGDPSVHVPKATGKAPAPRSPSPAPSDSSDEVVVFHGRNRPTIVNDPVSQATSARPSKAPSPQPRPSPHVTDGLLAALDQIPTKTRSPSPSKAPAAVPATGWASKPSKFDATQQETESWQPAPAVPYWKKNKSDLTPPDMEDTTMGGSRSQVKIPDMDAEDTIAALQSEVRRSLKEKKMAKGDINRRRKRGRKKDNRQMRATIVSDGEDDEDAAYEDYMENLKAQLEAGEDIPSFAAAALGLSREGPSMVVDGKEVGDDDVLDPQDEIWESDDTSEEGAIGQDVDELSDDEQLNLSDLDSSDLEDELEYAEHEQWEDEDDLRQRRLEAMDDEQLARLWAKQIELGIEDDELVIDDGMFDEYSEGYGDVDEARLGLEDITNSAFGKRAAAKNGTRRSRRGHNDFAFPSASALADSVEQYGDNGFDIMDYERPSLKPKKKGRKGMFPEELEMLSDDSLREEMAGQWENDRAKKRLKKAEREELRSQGMLGPLAKKGKADLSQKYQYGMTLPQIHDELRLFLQNDGQSSRPFPPMDKRDRKALHELADKFNLKSKSVGSGNKRFPVLYKTSHTVEYSAGHFERMASKSARKFFQNSATKGKKAAKTPKRGGGAGAGRGGGFDKSAVSLRHGEVVGGGAAELGRENFGHRLMEKMGWSKGQALGKEGEGMLTPVAQVMRTGRSGLG